MDSESKTQKQTGILLLIKMEDVVWMWGQNGLPSSLPHKFSWWDLHGPAEYFLCHLLEGLWPSSHLLGSDNLSERPLMYSSLKLSYPPDSEKWTNEWWQALSIKHRQIVPPTGRIQIATVSTAGAKFLFCEPARMWGCERQVPLNTRKLSSCVCPTKRHTAQSYMGRYYFSGLNFFFFIPMIYLKLIW